MYFLDNFDVRNSLDSYFKKEIFEVLFKQSILSDELLECGYFLEDCFSDVPLINFVKEFGQNTKKLTVYGLIFDIFVFALEKDDN